jgi:SMODS and SLOG-associating 2TM effector domain family 4
MFQLSLVDHIRLSFGHVVYSHRAHAQVAERLALRAAQMRAAILTLTAVATAAAVLALGGDRRIQITAAVCAGLAFALYALAAALDLEPRAYAHRACAARLWLLCEKYRALLAEVHDGLIDVPAVTERRDALMREVQAVYEYALPSDRDSYQIAHDALADTGGKSLSDQAIDRFLPPSLRQAHDAPR